MAVQDRNIHKDAKIALQVARCAPIPDGVITPCVISINASAEKFDVATFEYMLEGRLYTKAAETALVLSAVHATGIGKWMHILVMIDRTGNVTTKANPNTGDQDAATEAAALTALPRADAGKVAIGIITLETNAADWDGNTDDFDDADLVSTNMFGFQGDRRLAIFRPDFNYSLAEAKLYGRLVSGIMDVEIACPLEGNSEVITHPRLAVDRRTVADATVVDIKVGAFDYCILGVVYHKDATTGIAFTAAHVVALNQWGAILVQINAAGTVSTLVGEATQTTPLDYATAALAIAALPSPASGNIAIGHILIEADAGTWTAGTDDLVDASDLETQEFYPETTDRHTSAIGLAIDSGEAEDFHVDAFTFVINGIEFSKAAADGIDFTAAHVVTALKWGAILVEIDVAGTVTTRVNLIDGRAQTTAMAFATRALAVAALPGAVPGRLAIGYIVINADAGNWTANTDDMTDGGDLTTAEFISLDVPINTLFGVQSMPFTQDTLVAATLQDVRARRGVAEILVLLGGTTGVVEDLDVHLGWRPIPLVGESLPDVATGLTA